jgi:hypothetical protein
MIDDLKKTISSTLYERVTSPLIGSFAVSWSIWNYKFFLIILSSGPYSQKKVYLDEMFPGFWLNTFNMFVMPLCGTCFYLFAYPHIAKFVYEIWQKYIADKEKIRQDVKKEIPITEEQANKLRQSLASKTIEFENLLSDKSERIKNLEARGDKSMTHIDEQEEKISELSELITKHEIDLKAFRNREKVISDMNLTTHETGTLTRGGSERYCSKCFYSEPFKLIKIQYGGKVGEYNVCPVCSAKYTYDNYYNRALNKDDLSGYPHPVDDVFLCWQNNNGKIKYCPTCSVKGNNLHSTTLAKLSDDKYICLLCQKEYDRITPIAEQGKG